MYRLFILVYVCILPCICMCRIVLYFDMLYTYIYTYCYIILYLGNLKNSGKVLNWLIDQKSKQLLYVNVFK